MKVCFFPVKEIDVGAAGSNGVVRVASSLARELRSRGNEVFFYPPPFSEKSENLSESATARFCRFLREHAIDVAVWHMGSANRPFPLDNLPCPLVSVWHMSPDYKASREYILRICERCKIPRPLHGILGSALPRFFIGKLYERVRRNAFFYATRHSARFVLLSEGFFPAFPPAKKFPEKICAIPNFMTAQRQDCAAEKEKILLFVGRLENGQKRVDFLLKIWAKLEKAFPQWRLEIVGDGPSRGELEALAGTLGLQRVTFEGFQKPEKYYRRAPIFCMTSAFEGFGMVLIEAAAFGCVPVAFESFAAVHDIISDGENGALVPPFDLDKYAETLAALMSDDALRERLAANTAQICEKFAPAKIVDRWEALFAEVLAGRR